MESFGPYVIQPGVVFTKCHCAIGSFLAVLFHRYLMVPFYDDDDAAEMNKLCCWQQPPSPNQIHLNFDTKFYSNWFPSYRQPRSSSWLETLCPKGIYPLAAITLHCTTKHNGKPIANEKKPCQKRPWLNFARSLVGFTLHYKVMGSLREGNTILTLMRSIWW